MNQTMKSGSLLSSQELPDWRTFHIDPTVTALSPELSIGVIIAAGINNHATHGPWADLLAAAATQAVAHLAGEDIPALPEISAWRETYRQFGVKPSKYRSSIESLYRSAVSGSVRRINPLVDIYNAISLQAGLPCGGEDLDRLQGDIRLTRADGLEPFTPLGKAENESPVPGEIIYRDDVGAFCRCWNWREAERTKLTATTTTALLCVESPHRVWRNGVAQACADLATLVQTHLGGRVVFTVLTAARPSLAFHIGADGPVIEQE